MPIIQNSSSNDQSGNMTITSSALLQREALRILSQMKSKPIIAVDLDYTVRHLPASFFILPDIALNNSLPLFPYTFSCGRQYALSIHVVRISHVPTMDPRNPKQFRATLYSVQTRRHPQHDSYHYSLKCVRCLNSVWTTKSFSQSVLDQLIKQLSRKYWKSLECGTTSSYRKYSLSARSTTSAT